MKVRDNSADRLVLRGTPGGVVWMAFAALLGLAVMAATLGFGWAIVVQEGQWGPAIPLAVGFLLGLLFFVMGVATLAVGRVALTLDRPAGEGAYEVRSPIVDVGKPCRFRLEHVAGVELRFTEEARPDDHEGRNFDAQVCRARLLVNKPRRAITLDETENGQTDRVRHVGEATAAWLGVELREERG